MNLYLFFILIGTLIILLAYYFPVKVYGLEKFEDYQSLTDTSNFKLTFPKKDELIDKIASVNYFKFFKQSDANARGIKLKLNDFQEKYSSSIISIENQEKESFMDFYNQIIESIPRTYRIALLIPDLKIAKVSGIENSYPHTHSDIVVFDKSYYSSLNKDSFLENNISKASTLIHEIVHVKQREIPTKFDDLYHSWGFQSVSYQYLISNLSDDIVSRIRLNPDELPHYRFWVWNNKVMPLVIYSSIDVNKIDQIFYIGVDWKNKKKYSNIEDWTEYIEYFGISHNSYHPIEILAEYHANYYKELIGKSKKKNQAEGYKIYKKYFSFR
jgi:hypothetical protein